MRQPNSGSQQGDFNNVFNQGPGWRRLGARHYGGLRERQVVVWSKIDTEGGVLGNIIQLVLNANNIKTTDRIQLGGTPVVRKAITAGEIDIYPEYTGNAAFFFEKADDPVWKDAAKGYETAKKLDYDANKIVWLSPSPANNTWAIALRKEVAETNKLATVRLRKYVWRQDCAGGLGRFVNSAAALPAFQTTYGFTLKPDQCCPAATRRRPSPRQRTRQMGPTPPVYGTDGGIASVWLCSTTTRRAAGLPAAPIIEVVLKEHPEIRRC
jgi:osmoprotectant transport system substrate-binding protein